MQRSISTGRPTDVDHNHRSVSTLDGQSIGELLRSLATDATHLVQQEFHLARTELKETSEHLSHAAVQLGVALVVGLAGAMALVAFLVIALGDVLNNYAVSALIIGVMLSVVAAIMLTRATRITKRRDVGLHDTAASLREDAHWAKKEVKAFKRELTA
jgi:uncharacterized membrane protein YqjE